MLEFAQLLKLKSIIRYLPLKDTAGLAILRVNGPNLLPCPPAKSMAIHSCLRILFHNPPPRGARFEARSATLEMKSFSSHFALHTINLTPRTIKSRTLHFVLQTIQRTLIMDSLVFLFRTSNFTPRTSNNASHVLFFYFELRASRLEPRICLELRTSNYE